MVLLPSLALRATVLKALPNRRILLAVDRLANLFVAFLVTALPFFSAAFTPAFAWLSSTLSVILCVTLWVLLMTWWLPVARWLGILGLAFVRWSLAPFLRSGGLRKWSRLLRGRWR